LTCWSVPVPTQAEPIPFQADAGGEHWAPVTYVAAAGAALVHGLQLTVGISAVVALGAAPVTPVMLQHVRTAELAAQTY
jgi:hypothetical protein